MAPGYAPRVPSNARQTPVKRPWTLEHVIATGAKPTVGVSKEDCKAYHAMRAGNGWDQRNGNGKIVTQAALEADMIHTARVTLPNMRADAAAKAAKAAGPRKGITPGYTGGL